MSLKAIRRAVRREREERARVRAERTVVSDERSHYRGAEEAVEIAIEPEPGPAKRGLLSSLLDRLGRRGRV